MTVQTDGVIEIDFNGFQKCLLIGQFFIQSETGKNWEAFLKTGLRNGKVDCRTFLLFQLDLIH